MTWNDDYVSVQYGGGGGWTHVFDTRMDDCNNVGKWMAQSHNNNIIYTL